MHDSPLNALRLEIATRAARLIAEEGLDYAGAKRRAAREVTGEGRNTVRGDCLPDNAQIENEVRAYQALFMADTQPARLRALRVSAVEVMRWLTAFRPHLVGAVLNGTAGHHSDIHLQLYCDSAKEVEIFLINAGVDFETSESASHHGRAGSEPVETLSFVWRRAWQPGEIPPPAEGVHLTILRFDDLRIASRAATERADLSDVEALLADPQSDRSAVSPRIS